MGFDVFTTDRTCFPLHHTPPWCRSLEWELLKRRQEEKFPHVDGSKDLLNACKQGVLW